ncbi:MAG: hypothetical protein LC127_06360 [Chitinophagales bacterium]|nr:hypothetical protein [Chitinophagales bacterium]
MSHLKIFYFAFLTFIGFNLRELTYISATGGTITTDGDYKVHTFTSSRTFTVTTGSGNVQVLVVGGGGSGVSSTARGGGASWLIYESAYDVIAQSYTVTEGVGGVQTAERTTGNNGQNSVFRNITAYGGGGGEFTNNTSCGRAGLNGRSGGGGTEYVGWSYTNGMGTAGQGNNGGTYGTDIYPGGGGSSTLGGIGGIGGGRAGTSNGYAGTAGTANTGGGGRFYSGGVEGAGGSGIVKIRYQFQNTRSLWITSANNIFYDAGSVGIGTVNINDPNYKLFVEAGIRTRKVKIDQSSWSDYVFHKEYKLPYLEEIVKYIKAN